MPRPKEDSKKKNKKNKEKNENEIIEEDETVKNIKSPKKEDEDELSDLELVEEEVPTHVDESLLEGHKNQLIKVVDPKTPIGELKTDDILTYLIQVGKDTLNPQLKFGAYNLLMQLTGRRRIYPFPPRRQFSRGRSWRRGRRISYQEAQVALSKAKTSEQITDSKNSNLYGEK
ncbi:MAG: hypothetical protein QXW79_00280 [Thermoplasmata archaeon]